MLSKHRESRDSDSKDVTCITSGKMTELLGGTRASIQKLMESKHSDFLPKRTLESTHHSVTTRDHPNAKIRFDKDKKRQNRGRKSKDRTVSASSRSQKTISLSQNRKMLRKD